MVGELWTPSAYDRLCGAWAMRMEYLRAGDQGAATEVWGAAFYKEYPFAANMIEWTRVGDFVHCTVAGVMFFEDTVGWPLETRDPTPHLLVRVPK